MNTLAFIPGMSGGAEGILILAVILLLFGPKKLPALMRALGKSLSEFKKGQQEGNQPEENEPAESVAAPKEKLSLPSEPQEKE